MVRRSSLVAMPLLGMLLALAGCSGSDEPSAQPTVDPTPITKLDVASVEVARVEFCDRVPEAAVRRALGADPETDDSWGNGDPVPGAGDGDVAQELGCAWTGPSDTEARAWVFAQPVTTQFATDIARRAGRGKACAGDVATVFGDPALLQACTQGPVEQLRRAGLFGDSWLTCELTLPTSLAEKDRRARLDRWCAQVVATLDVSGG